MCACSCDPIGAVFVSVDQNVAQLIVQTELQEAVTGGSMRPTVFVAVVHAQAARFGGFLESLVVVGVTPAAILDTVLIVEVMYHFMQQRGSDFFDGSCQRSCTDVDFVRCAKL